jgi:hypothetical protein
MKHITAILILISSLCSFGQRSYRTYDSEVDFIKKKETSFGNLTQRLDYRGSSNSKLTKYTCPDTTYTDSCSVTRILHLDSVGRIKTDTNYFYIGSQSKQGIFSTQIKYYTHSIVLKELKSTMSTYKRLDSLVYNDKGQLLELYNSHKLLHLFKYDDTGRLIYHETPTNDIIWEKVFINYYEDSILVEKNNNSFSLFSETVLKMIFDKNQRVIESYSKDTKTKYYFDNGIVNKDSIVFFRTDTAPSKRFYDYPNDSIIIETNFSNNRKYKSIFQNGKLVKLITTEVDNYKGRDTVITTFTYSGKTESSFYDQGDGIKIVTNKKLYDNGEVKTIEHKVLKKDTIIEWARLFKNQFGQIIKDSKISKNKLKKSIIWIEETNTP